MYRGRSPKVRRDGIASIEGVPVLVEYKPEHNVRGVPLRGRPGSESGRGEDERNDDEEVSFLTIRDRSQDDLYQQMADQTTENPELLRQVYREFLKKRGKKGRGSESGAGRWPERTRLQETDMDSPDRKKLYLIDPNNVTREQLERIVAEINRRARERTKAQPGQPPVAPDRVPPEE